MANMSSAKNINRITLFKIPEVSNQEKLLAVYKSLQQNALKVFLALSPSINHSLTDHRTESLTSYPYARDTPSQTSAPKAIR